MDAATRGCGSSKRGVDSKGFYIKGHTYRGGIHTHIEMDLHIEDICIQRHGGVYT